MQISTRRDVFHAIADPTRREIIGLIAGRKLNVNAVAENFRISRPAISKQLKILAECGLVVIRREGRDRFCEAKLDRLNDVADWVEKYRTFWTARLDALEKFLDRKNLPPGPMLKSKVKK